MTALAHKPVDQGFAAKDTTGRQQHISEMFAYAFCGRADHFASMRRSTRCHHDLKWPLSALIPSPFTAIASILDRLMSTQTPHNPFRRSDVIRRFDRAAADFADNDFVHRHACDGLLERMRPMQLKAKRILDLGCATGAGSRQLSRALRRNHVISLDISQSMLQCARQQRSRLARISELRADAMQLPLNTGSVDLVFANMLLPWIGDLDGFFTEVARVLRNDGLFAYSTLGPASLAGLRQAWSSVDDHAHVNPFVDMHNVADAVMRAGLRDPIVDIDPLFISYRDLSALFRDLTATGARNCLRTRFPHLTGKQHFQRMRHALQKQFHGGTLSVELEIVYGHAWGGGPRQKPGEFRVDPSQIGRRQG